MAITRREFCALTVPLLIAPRLVSAQPKPTARPDVAAIDHDRILKAAEPLLSQPVKPLTAMPCPRSPGTLHDYYSEPEDAGVAAPFVAHREALLELCIAVPALTAAFLLTHDARYSRHAIAHVRGWFIDPATAMTPSLPYAQTVPPAKTGRPEGVIEAVHLAELVQCIQFLAATEDLSDVEHGALAKWCADYLDWLNTSRMAGLARDTKSHLGTAWLLQAAAMARTNISDDRPLTALRHLYHSATLRAQITAQGTFPHELTTANPYRNSIFNLDMLATICLLLSTRFEDVWQYELQDGPGMHTAMAYHVPYIGARGTWPYRADASLFTSLPIRPPSLLFAARAYGRPEYAALWTTLPPDPPVPELQRTFPVRQPLLWVTRPRP